MLAPRAEAQDPSGPWRTLHAPHFRVHFRPAYRDVADVAAREAERAYRLLASELHPPRQVVDLTLVDDIDAANGATLVFPSDRFLGAIHELPTAMTLERAIYEARGPP